MCSFLFTEIKLYMASTVLFSLSIQVVSCDATCRYVGESIIIHSVGTCFAVGYTAGWA
jgi:hypothetical protein